LIINLRISHSFWIWYEVGVMEILSC
jgi:hypothetical protein